MLYSICKLEWEVFFRRIRLLINIIWLILGLEWFKVKGIIFRVFVVWWSNVVGICVDIIKRKGERGLFCLRFENGFEEGCGFVINKEGYGLFME